jgi:hypothetical protein
MRVNSAGRGGSLRPFIQVDIEFDDGSILTAADEDVRVVPEGTEVVTSRREGIDPAEGTEIPAETLLFPWWRIRRLRRYTSYVTGETFQGKTD